ncbi:MAG: hypothetical protein N3E40_06945 [Dehalococcoidia bacterium]|nr:hypothetical protein [Dehalococcoidia bacterium]
MTVPLTDYIGMGFSWLLFVACIVAFVATTGKAGELLGFWLLFAAGFASFGTAYTFAVVFGAHPDEWFQVALLVTGWVFITLAIIVSIWSLNEERFG